MGPIDGDLQMIMRLAALLFASLLLSGCETGRGLTSIPGGESKVFEAPPYVVKGKAPYDQNWIDSQVEGGVAAFGWPRPAPRPPGLDAPASAPRKAVVPKKKKGLLRRVKDRIIPPAAASVWPDPSTFRSNDAAPAPHPPATVTVDPPPVPPPRRDDVDELLDAPPIPNARRVR